MRGITTGDLRTWPALLGTRPRAGVPDGLVEGAFFSDAVLSDDASNELAAARAAARLGRPIFCGPLSMGARLLGSSFTVGIDPPGDGAVLSICCAGAGVGGSGAEGKVGGGEGSAKRLETSKPLSRALG